MKKQKGYTIVELLFLIVWLAALGGYIMNVYKFAKCDFKPSYAAEAIRAVGIFVPPAGVVLGYITITDTPEK